MKSLPTLAILLLLAAAPPRALSEDFPNRRSGLAVAAGLGMGWAEVQLDTQNLPWEAGLVGSLRLGWAWGDTWVAGMDFYGWKSTGGPNTHYSNTALTMTLFPQAGSFFLRGGAGWALGAFNIPDEQGSSARQFVRQTGLGLLLGMGYEIRTHQSLALGFELDANVLLLNDYEVNGAAGSVNVSYTSLTVAYTWYAR